jgi:hypothetical protein
VEKVSNDAAASKAIFAALPDCPTGRDDVCDCKTCSFFAEEDAYFTWAEADARLCLERDMLGVTGTGSSREAGWAA